MVDHLVDAVTLQALPRSGRSTLDLVSSRERAVARVFRGGTLALTGSILTAGPLFFFMEWTDPVFLTYLVGLTATGTGLTLAGLAANHLRRFGGNWSTLFFTVVGGAGASGLVWAAASGLEGFLGHSLGVLMDVGEIGFWLFSGLAALLVLGTLLRWLAGPFDDRE